jgi:putative transposase
MNEHDSCGWSGLCPVTVRPAQLGQPYANQLRHRRPRPGDKWHLDEVVLTIKGERHYLCLVVDQEENVLDILV